MSILKLAILATLNHPGYKPWMRAADMMVVVAMTIAIVWWLL